MKKNDIIVDLLLKNAYKDEKILLMNKALSNAYNLFICIGGPFNDNKLNFNKDQLLYLRKIVDIVGTSYE